MTTEPNYYYIDVLWHPDYSSGSKWEAMPKETYLEEYGLTEHEWNELRENGAVLTPEEWNNKTLM